MKDNDKTKEKLIEELSELRKKIDKSMKAASEHRNIDDGLRESEERYRSLVESTEDSIYLVDRNCNYLFMNKKHLSRLGLSRKQFIGQAFRDFHTQKETETLIKKVDRIFKTGKSAQYEYRSDRDNKYFLQTFSPVKNRSGETIAITVVSKDITKRKQTEMALQESEERFHALFNQASDSIFLLKPKDGELIIVDTNYAACSMHGYIYGEIIGKPVSFLNDEETGARVKERTELLMSGELLTFDGKHVRKDGSTFPVAVSARLIKIGNEPYVLAIDRDISERKMMEEELRALSLTDSLTGLYNRRGCLTLAEQLFKIANREKRGLYILYADLDNMKMINDELGHKEGDMALICVADVLKENFRGSDIIARIGGDEFVVIPVGTAGDNEKIIISRLQKSLKDHIAQNKCSYRLSLSIGLAYYDPENPCSVDELLARADRVMYEQKRHKNKF